jgi:hypothetical protein
MTAALGSIEEHGYQFFKQIFLALAPEQLLQIRECIPSDGGLTSVSEMLVLRQLEVPQLLLERSRFKYGRISVTS